MKRCVDSGLWKPSADDPDTNPEDGFKRGAQPEDSQDDSESYANEWLEYVWSERTKQMEQILNFQVPSEGLELVILLHTQY